MVDLRTSQLELDATLLASVALLSGWRWRRRSDPLDGDWFPGLLAICAPLGFVAVEAKSHALGDISP